MKSPVVRQTLPRSASLNPFDIDVPPSCHARTDVECRTSLRGIDTEAPEEGEEFGCVDWYSYPARRGHAVGFSVDR